MNKNQIRDYIQYLNPEAYNRLKISGKLERKVESITNEMQWREIDLRDKLLKKLHKSEEYRVAQDTDFEKAMAMAKQIPLDAEEMVRAEAEEIIKGL